MATKISGDRAFGDIEAELPKFPADLRRSPVGVFGRHSPDESPNRFAYLRPGRSRAEIASASAGESPPDAIRSRIRFHEDQNIRPSRPDSPQSGLEEEVEVVQGRAPTFACEYGDLLARREDLK